MRALPLCTKNKNTCEAYFFYKTRFRMVDHSITLRNIIFKNLTLKLLLKLTSFSLNPFINSP